MPHAPGLCGNGTESYKGATIHLVSRGSSVPNTPFNILSLYSCLVWDKKKLLNKTRWKRGVGAVSHSSMNVMGREVMRFELMDVQVHTSDTSPSQEF
jgi:hypothetical protein